MKRRDLIKAGIATSSLGFTTVAGAESRRESSEKRDFRRQIRQSLRVKERTDSVDKWVRQLRKNGFSVGRDSQHFRVPTGGHPDGGVSTQSVERSDLYIDITLTYKCPEYYYYTDLSWQWQLDDSDDAGSNPYDIAGIAWDPDWWTLVFDKISETTETSQYVSYRDGSSGFDGPAFNVDDTSQYFNGDMETVQYCGDYIETKGDYSCGERELQGGYSHTWNDVSITDVSVGLPAGVSVTVDESTYEWTTDTKNDGDTLLRLSECDANYESSCF